MNPLARWAATTDQYEQLSGGDSDRLNRSKRQSDRVVIDEPQCADPHGCRTTPLANSLDSPQICRSSPRPLVPATELPVNPFDISLGMLLGAYSCVSESAGLGDVIGSAWRCPILHRPSSFR